jgi:hypothetical protein
MVNYTFHFQFGIIKQSSGHSQQSRVTCAVVLKSEHAVPFQVVITMGKRNMPPLPSTH